MRARILFADDQVPPEELDDDEIVNAVFREHPNWSREFISAFPLMRGNVRKLRDSGRKVTVANTVESALQLARSEHFDIAIVDLKWDADEQIAKQERSNAGWLIARAIEDADRELSPGMRTAIVAYSSRFLEEPTIARDAAKYGYLPFYKVYDTRRSSQEAGQNALVALISWFENIFDDADPAHQARRASAELSDVTERALRAAINRRRTWDIMALITVALSMLLVIAGGVTALLGRTDAALVTTLSGVLTALVPRLLFRPLRESTREIEQYYGKLQVVAENSRVGTRRRKARPGDA